jgi:2C-methyl-D-erythritol 2,4-cyclodiphosphate synthase
MWLARERSLQVVNVDSTILLETPKLRPYVDAMRENIANVLELMQVVSVLKPRRVKDWTRWAKGSQ